MSKVYHDVGFKLPSTNDDASYTRTFDKKTVKQALDGLLQLQDTNLTEFVNGEVASFFGISMQLHESGLLVKVDNFEENLCRSNILFADRLGEYNAKAIMEDLQHLENTTQHVHKFLLSFDKFLHTPIKQLSNFKLSVSEEIDTKVAEDIRALNVVIQRIVKRYFTYLNNSRQATTLKILSGCVNLFKIEKKVLDSGEKPYHLSEITPEVIYKEVEKFRQNMNDILELDTTFDTSSGRPDETEVKKKVMNITMWLLRIRMMVAQDECFVGELFDLINKEIEIYNESGPESQITKRVESSNAALKAVFGVQNLSTIYDLQLRDLENPLIQIDSYKLHNMFLLYASEPKGMPIFSALLKSNDHSFGTEILISYLKKLDTACKERELKGNLAAARSKSRDLIRATERFLSPSAPTLSPRSASAAKPQAVLAVPIPPVRAPPPTPSRHWDAFNKEVQSLQSGEAALATPAESGGEEGRRETRSRLAGDLVRFGGTVKGIDDERRLIDRDAEPDITKGDKTWNLQRIAPASGELCEIIPRIAIGLGRGQIGESELEAVTGVLSRFMEIEWELVSMKGREEEDFFGVPVDPEAGIKNKMTQRQKWSFYRDQILVNINCRFDALKEIKRLMRSPLVSWEGSEPFVKMTLNHAKTLKYFAGMDPESDMDDHDRIEKIKDDVLYQLVYLYKSYWKTFQPDLHQAMDTADEGTSAIIIDTNALGGKFKQGLDPSLKLRLDTMFEKIFCGHLNRATGQLRDRLVARRGGNGTKSDLNDEVFTLSARAVELLLANLSNDPKRNDKFGRMETVEWLLARKKSQEQSGYAQIYSAITQKITTFNSNPDIHQHAIFIALIDNIVTGDFGHPDANIVSSAELATLQGDCAIPQVPTAIHYFYRQLKQSHDPVHKLEEVKKFFDPELSGESFLSLSSPSETARLTRDTPSATARSGTGSGTQTVTDMSNIDVSGSTDRVINGNKSTSHISSPSISSFHDIDFENFPPSSTTDSTTVTPEQLIHYAEIPTIPLVTNRAESGTENLDSGATLASTIVSGLGTIPGTTIILLVIIIIGMVLLATVACKKLKSMLRSFRNGRLTSNEKTAEEREEEEAAERLRLMQDRL